MTASDPRAELAAAAEHLRPDALAVARTLTPAEPTERTV